MTLISRSSAALALKACVVFSLAAAGCATVDGPPGAAPAAVTAAAAPRAAASAPEARVAAATTAAKPGSPSVATPEAAAAPAAAASGASAPTAAARPDPAAPKPFEEVIKGATEQAGYFGLWRKDEKLWLEIAPERLGQAFLLSVNISHSVGERRLYGSQMGPSWLASFRKIGSQQIQLIALNTNYVASGAPMKATIEQAFSHSLLASATIASAPHPQRKSVLVDAAFLLGDIAGYSTQLERAYRLPYGLDRSNSFFEKTRVSDDLTTLDARLHFATARLPAPPLMPSPVPMPSPPTTTPDPRSFFVGMVYSFTKLPDQADGSAQDRPAARPLLRRRQRPQHRPGCRTRASTTSTAGGWRRRTRRRRCRSRKQPITYWLDKNIPTQYRKSVEAGILEWNKAFERIGFRNASWSYSSSPMTLTGRHLDSRHASIRWFTGADVGFAIGPHHSDPRTGEIIDADIGMSDVFARGSRRFVVEDLGSVPRPSFAPQASAVRVTACTRAIATMRTRPRRRWTSRSICSKRVATSRPTAPRPKPSCRP